MTSKIFACIFLISVAFHGVVNCDDGRNITRLLNNQVIVNKQIMCVLEKSPCDQLGRQLKGRNLTEQFCGFKF